MKPSCVAVAVAADVDKILKMTPKSKKRFYAAGWLEVFVITKLYLLTLPSTIFTFSSTTACETKKLRSRLTEPPLLDF